MIQDDNLEIGYEQQLERLNHWQEVQKAVQGARRVVMPDVPDEEMYCNLRKVKVVDR